MRAPLLSLVALLVACGGPDLGDDTGDPGTLPEGCRDGAPPDEYVVGLSRQTVDDVYSFTFVDTLPSPPDVGDNTWTLDVNAPAGSVVRVRPWMPLHGHGTTPEWYEAGEQGGQWMFEEMNLFMPGLWEFRMTVDSTEEDTGALFRFCLEG